MYDNFEKLPEEKRNRIINACIGEFAKEGYNNASTNNIVREAEIAKGALFHYFGSKKGLYLYILDYTIDYYINYMTIRMKVNSSDFFQRILDWAKLKMVISVEEPRAYKFFSMAFINIPDELKMEIEARYKKLTLMGNSMALEGIDYSLFKGDIDCSRAVELIVFAFNGIAEKYIKIYEKLDDRGYENMEKSYNELERYVDLLRKVFYKN